MKKFVVLAVVLVFLFGTLAYGAAPVVAKKDNVKKVQKAKKKTAEPMVYVKDKGKKYHKKNCKAVKGKKGIKLSEAIKKGYTPCSLCKPATGKKKAPAVKKKSKKMKKVK